MTIRIDDPETVRVVRELARRLNVEPIEAVRRVSEAALEAGVDDEDAAIERIVAEVKMLPVSDARSIDEMLEGDEPR